MSEIGPARPADHRRRLAGRLHPAERGDRLRRPSRPAGDQPEGQARAQFVTESLLLSLLGSA